jgi:hypothetical protein
LQQQQPLTVQFPFPPSVTLSKPPSQSHPVVAPTPASAAQVESHAKQLHESYMRALQHNEQGDGRSDTPNSSVPSVPSAKQPEMPDFLSGFEKVVQRMNQPSTAVAQAKTDPSALVPASASPPDLPHSPPFTSRSFDDFHCFLGKDFTLYAETAEAKTSTTEPITAVSLLPHVVPDTSALFAPESYAMFAEESALATSRHGTDFLSISAEQKLPAKPLAMLATFDVDNVLNQVREHTFGSAVSTTTSSNGTSSAPTKARGRDKYKSETEDKAPAKPTKKQGLAESEAHVTSTKDSFAVERFMRSSNLVSGSEPSGSSSSNSNSNHEESSSMDTAGTDDCSEEESNNYSDSSSGGEMMAPHKKAKLDGKNSKTVATKSAPSRQVKFDHR